MPVYMKARVQKEKPGKTVLRERGRLLIVTDEPDSVDPEPLTSAGLEIVGVCGGAAALGILSEKTYSA